MLIEENVRMLPTIYETGTELECLVITFPFSFCFLTNCAPCYWICWLSRLSDYADEQKGDLLINALEMFTLRPVYEPN